MRQQLCFYVLAIAVFLAAGESGFAQDEALSHYKKGKMVEIADMLGPEDLERCSTASSKRYAGTVATVELTNEGPIENFTLKTAKANVRIYLSPSLYAERISKADAAALPTLIARGRKITVDTYLCGGSRKRLTALYILAGIQLETLGLVLVEQ